MSDREDHLLSTDHPDARGTLALPSGYTPAVTISVSEPFATKPSLLR